MNRLQIVRASKMRPPRFIGIPCLFLCCVTLCTSKVARSAHIRPSDVPKGCRPSSVDSEQLPSLPCQLQRLSRLTFACWDNIALRGPTFIAAGYARQTADSRCREANPPPSAASFLLPSSPTAAALSFSALAGRTYLTKMREPIQRLLPATQGLPALQ